MSDREHDVERLQEAFGASTVAVPPCPDSARIWEASQGLLSPGATADIVDHLAVCGACAESWRVAKEIGSSTAAGVQRQARTPVIAWTLMAAAAAVMLAAGVWMMTRVTAPAPQAPIASAPPVLTPTPTAPPRTPEAQIAKAPVILSASRVLVFRSDRGVDPFVEEFGRAIDPYRRDEYAAAVTALQALARKYPDADEPPLYLGISLLMLNRADEARPHLERAARARDAAIVTQARKYLSGPPR